MKNSMLQTLLDTIFNAIKQSMHNLPLVVWEEDYATDQRYIKRINVINKEVVAN